MSQDPSVNRRELATRKRAWAPAAARALARLGATPNQISLLSILFAIGAGLAIGASADATRGRAWLLVLGAIGIQLRLLCNMLDGLLAIECGLKSKTGDLYNEVPDRVADVAILLGAGIAFRHDGWGLTLGWTAALLAVLTAYVRLLGGSLGFSQEFIGPMAKQHRMFTLTVGALAAAGEVAGRGTIWSLAVALAIVVVGSAWTLVRRTIRIARRLEAR